ncbi:MAG: HEAT repeat domain-containing protein [Euryarchaeota archaeon]|nr:HEAT repeat domain-containing protein [Euryarchaeota archaeon]MBU4339657.1 HEAT repeat domain-containing protein [Euryarchaeota archaeon]MCG2737262.1 HEAT repeat domain-containing protein [Candidatus Methanoperedenaceae archaeon]
MVDQAEIHRMAASRNEQSRIEAVEELRKNFVDLPDKKQAWHDLARLKYDTYGYVRKCVVEALGSAFSSLPDTEQAWDDMLRLTLDDIDNGVGRGPGGLMCLAFSASPDKKKLSWHFLHILTSDDDVYLRWGVAGALGSAFSHIPDKKQAWDDLHQLTLDTERNVRASAYHSLGKVSILKAANAENDNDLKKEMEAAIGYFERSSKQKTFPSSAKFCLPFYRSFYTLTFKKEETETEVQKYITEAKIAVEGSESKEKLLEAVENLGNALKEVQKARDFNTLKSDLNAYRRFCDRACELLDTTEEKAPGASRLIRRGLPIIDERIKGIIAEIQEKAKALCKQVKDTEYKEIGQQVNNVGQELLKVIDPIRLDKEVSRMLIPLSAMCKKMPEEDRGEACEILKQINDEQNVEDKLPLISMFLSKISTQMDQKTVYVNIEKSKNVQVSIGKDNYQVQSSNSPHEKD